MDEAEKSAASVVQAEEKTQPRLSESFFELLLNPPSCKTVGICDGCGRCER